MNVIHCAANHRTRPMAAKKLIYVAADRNKDPILCVLRNHIKRGSDQIFLEISSGSGQHISHFAPHFPQITFYPSEYQPQLLESISAHSSEYTNVKAPLKIDVTTDCKTWGDGIFQEGSLDYLYNANMTHISPYECTIGLFKNAGKLLKPSGKLFTYGPFAINGEITPESNVKFDKSLKFRNPEWGIRDLRDLKKLANENGVEIISIVDMPANNKTIIWEKC